MGNPRGWHSHTVSPERWLALKSQYAQRCSADLAESAAKRGAGLRLQALETERDTHGDPFGGEARLF